MSLLLGRLPSTIALDPARTRVRRGEVTFDGTFVTTSSAEVVAMVEMLTGMPSIDEPVIPVVYDEQDELNGFYVVENVDVTLAPDSIDNGHFEWSVDLREVPDRAHPAIESMLIGGFRPNDRSIVAADADAWHVVPDATLDYSLSSSPDVGAVLSVTTETGQVRLANIYDQSGVRRQIATWSVPPEDYYVGAAVLEQKLGGTWYPVTGREIAATATAWRITNGYVRLTSVEGDATRLDLEAWSTTWRTSRTFQMEVDALVPFADPELRLMSTAVVRNAPEEVILRTVWTFGDGNSTMAPQVIDLRLRRGAPIVDFTWTTKAGTNMGRPGILTWDTTPTWTSITGGAWDSGNAGTGDVLLYASKNNDTDGDISTSWQFGLGYAVNYATASDPYDAAYAVLRWFAPMWERATIIGR